MIWTLADKVLADKPRIGSPKTWSSSRTVKVLSIHNFELETNKDLSAIPSTSAPPNTLREEIVLKEDALLPLANKFFQLEQIIEYTSTKASGGISP
jgi:hypothetical protein